MKWIYRFFTIAMLSAALIGPFFLKNKDGQLMMEMPTADDFIPDKIIPDSLMPGSASTQADTPAQGSGQTFYKWKDAQGVWHYGDQPPAGVKVSTLQVDTNTNIIQSFKIEPKEDATVTQQANVPSAPDRLTDGKLTIDDAMNAMGDARAVRDMMESRNEQLKAITGE